VIKSHLGTDAIATIERKMQNRRIGGVRSRAGSDIETKTPESRSTDRRKVERRKLIDPTTCERDYSLDEVEFMKAMDDYKRKSGRMFPTWSEVLEVVRGLGYEKQAKEKTV
jgi:hypothetical protein